jgi:hypothetical protein
MSLRILLLSAAVLLATPVLALAQAIDGLPAVRSAPAPDKKATTVEGVVVQPKPKAGLPQKSCAAGDTACITLVVQTLKTQYPDAFRNLAAWCMNREASRMAQTVEATSLAETSGQPDPRGGGHFDTDAQQASCDVVWRESRTQ